MTSQPAGSDAEHLGWLRQAVALAARSVTEGGGPFGALIVRNSQLVASGHNRVTLDHDPTAHAEVNAIRAATGITRNHVLAGAVLYSSCEPCPMCSAAIHWARLDHVYYAATRQDAADAGFDDARIAVEASLPEGERTPPLVRTALPGAEAVLPFRAWKDRHDRIPY